MSDSYSRLLREMGVDQDAQPNAMPVPPIPPQQSSQQRLYREMGVPEPAAASDAKDWGAAPWTEVAGSALRNAPGSALNVGKSIYQAVTNPVETAGAIGQVGTGLYSKAKGMFTDQDPEQKARDEAVVNAIGADYANRYGSMAGFKKAVATDPFSVGMDVSLPLTVAGSAPGMAGRAARIAARAIDPVQGAMFTAGQGAKAVGSVAQTIQSAQSGVPRSLLQVAERAGASDNPALRDAFLRFHRGQGDIAELSSTARRALEEIRDNASQRYLTEMGSIRANQTPLPFTLMDRALGEAREHTQFAGVRSPHNFGPANVTIDRAEALINAYRQNPAAQTMEGFDKLKRALWDLGEQSGNTEAKRAINKLYDAARSTVAAQDPQYAKLMEFYQGHIQNVNDLTRGLGLGQTAPASTTVSRLRTAARKPEKQSLLDQLGATQAGQELPYMLAGAGTHASLSDAMHIIGNAVIASQLYGVHPVAGPAVAAAQAMGSSPRMVGSMNYGAGAVRRAAQAPKRAAEGLVPGLARVPDDLVHYIPYYGGEIAGGQNQGGRIGRASGGKVGDIDHLVDRLLKLSGKAHKEHAATTKPLLNVDDNTIAHALKTADHAI